MPQIFCGLDELSFLGSCIAAIERTMYGKLGSSMQRPITIHKPPKNTEP